MKRLTFQVRDFQIIERADLEAEGVTCIVGPSNSGKTALFRAMEACLYNRLGDDFVRLPDADAARVLVVFDDDDPMEVAWKKPRGGGATYSVDGVAYSTVGRSSLSEVTDRGLSALETRRATGAGAYRLNFWRQGELFLVDEPETRVFDMVSELMVERELVPVLQKMKMDCTDLRRDAAASEKSLIDEREEAIRIEERLASLVSVDADDPGFEGLLGDLGFLEAALAGFAALDDADRILSDASSGLSECAVHIEVLASADILEGDVESCELVALAIGEVGEAVEAFEDASSALSRVVVEVTALDAALDGADEFISLKAAYDALLVADDAFVDKSADLKAVLTEMAAVEAGIEEASIYIGTCVMCGAPTVGGIFVVGG